MELTNLKIINSMGEEVQKITAETIENYIISGTLSLTDTEKNDYTFIDIELISLSSREGSYFLETLMNDDFKDVYNFEYTFSSEVLREFNFLSFLYNYLAIKIIPYPSSNTNEENILKENICLYSSKGYLEPCIFSKGELVDFSENWFLEVPIQFAFAAIEKDKDGNIKIVDQIVQEEITLDGYDLKFDFFGVEKRNFKTGDILYFPEYTFLEKKDDETFNFYSYSISNSVIGEEQTDSINVNWLWSPKISINTEIKKVDKKINSTSEYIENKLGQYVQLNFSIILDRLDISTSLVYDFNYSIKGDFYSDFIVIPKYIDVGERTASKTFINSIFNASFEGEEIKLSHSLSLKELNITKLKKLYLEISFKGIKKEYILEIPSNFYHSLIIEKDSVSVFDNRINTTFISKADKTDLTTTKTFFSTTNYWSKWQLLEVFTDQVTIIAEDIPMIRMNLDGIVQIKGFIKSTGKTKDTIIGQVPNTCMPLKRTGFMAPSTGINGWAKIFIETNGDIVMKNPQNATTDVATSNTVTLDLNFQYQGIPWNTEPLEENNIYNELVQKIQQYPFNFYENFPIIDNDTSEDRSFTVSSQYEDFPFSGVLNQGVGTLYDGSEFLSDKYSFTPWKPKENELKQIIIYPMRDFHRSLEIKKVFFEFNSGLENINKIIISRFASFIIVPKNTKAYSSITIPVPPSLVEEKIIYVNPDNPNYLEDLNFKMYGADEYIIITFETKPNTTFELNNFYFSNILFNNYTSGNPSKTIYWGV